MHNATQTPPPRLYVYAAYLNRLLFLLLLFNFNISYLTQIEMTYFGNVI